MDSGAFSVPHLLASGVLDWTHHSPLGSFLHLNHHPRVSEAQWTWVLASWLAEKMWNVASARCHGCLKGSVSPAGLSTVNHGSRSLWLQCASSCIEPGTPSWGWLRTWPNQANMRTRIQSDRYQASDPFLESSLLYKLEIDCAFRE